MASICSIMREKTKNYQKLYTQNYGKFRLSCACLWILHSLADRRELPWFQHGACLS